MKKSNNYSKFVATAATATLVATAVVPAASAKEMKFTDVSDRYVDAVNYLVKNNITQGISDSKFGTQLNIKRVDVAVLIAKATLTEDEINKAPASKFNDVPARATKYVSALKEKGIINGKTDTLFGSDQSITRGEAAIMLSKAYGIKGNTANVKFGDVGQRYKEAVAALVDNKITTGKTDTSFGTTQSITRGELAIFLHRLETLDATAQEYKVESVEGVNGTQIEVKFTDAVNPASLFKDGKTGEFKDGVFTMSKVSNVAETATGSLSKDGKTLTVTTGKVVEGDYTVVIDKVKSADNKAIEKFSKVVTIAADKTAPKVLTTEKVNASQYKVKFSEPIKTLGNITYKDENGNTVEALANTFKEGATEVLFTLPSTLEAGKAINLQMVAAKDMSGNLISPNPTEFTLTKGQPDGVAPTVKSIEQINANQFTVLFSEELVGNPTVTVGGKATTVEKDAENPLKYVVTAGNSLTTAQTVVVNGFSDLSGQAGTDYSKVITFTEDTEAPVVTGTNIVADATDLKQYVEFTFNKDVTLTDAKVSAKGSYIKDNITTPNVTLDAKTVSYKDQANKKVVRVALTDLLGDTADVEGAKYDLTYTLSGVKSLAGVALSENTGNLKFTRVADEAPENTEVVGITSVQAFTDADGVVDNNKVKVVFDKKVDGASAVNKANYSIEGATIDSVTLLAAKGGTQEAILNLTPGSSTFNGERTMTIKNIKALGSTKTMEQWNGTVDLKENVAPTVTSANLTETNKITLTFSEAVTSGALADFAVLSDGKTIANANEMNAVIGADKKTATITLNTALTSDQINKGITLKPVETMDIKDENGNLLSVPTNITVSN